MQTLIDSDTTSKRQSLHETVSRARAQAGEAQRLAASILTAAVRLYSADDAGWGWLWRGTASNG